MKTQSAIQILKTKPILEYSRYCLILSGIWPQLSTENRIIQKVYTIYSGIVKLYLPSFLISLSIEFILSTFYESTEKNLEKIFSQLNYIIILLITCFAIMLCQRREIEEIITYMMQDNKDVVSSKDEDIIQCHLAQSRVCSRSCLLIVILTFGSGMSICLENIWRRYEIGQYNKYQNGTAQKPLSFELYYYKLDACKYGTSLLVADNLFVAVNCLLFASTKMLFFSCIIYSSSILKRLQIKVQKLNVRGGSVLGVLRDLVQQHQNTIQFVGKLNSWIKYLIFWEFLLNSLNIAIVSILLITLGKNMLISPILFFCVLCTQTFILGWSANEIKCQSLMLADALYCSPWCDQSLAAKSVLLTMLVQAQRPLVLTIGPLDAMTTQSALTIMKGSYSYVSIMLNNYN